MIATLAADVLTAWMTPGPVSTSKNEGLDMSDDKPNDGATPDLVPVAVEPEVDRAAERRQARRERLRLLYRSPSFVIGILIVGFWIFSGTFPDLVARYDPLQPVRTSDGSILVARLPPSSEACSAPIRPEETCIPAPSPAPGACSSPPQPQRSSPSSRARCSA